MNNVGVLLSSLRARTLAAARAKRDAILSLPVISTVNEKVKHWVSPENRDMLRGHYHDAYHWIVGTEVTEVQERARYLESKLNFSRKDMRVAREQLETVVERLRNITSELERTGRGDVKAIHLRQKEYEAIQEEMRLHKVVQKAEFEERETFSLLMNTVRESHETERNYNQRIKMISLIGAIVGPFVGYLFSARLNAMRFRKMEDILDQKLHDLSVVTVNAVKTIHGIPVEDTTTETEQATLLENLKLYLMNGYTVAQSTYGYILEQLNSLVELFQTTDPPETSNNVQLNIDHDIPNNNQSSESLNTTSTQTEAPIIGSAATQTDTAVVSTTIGEIDSSIKSVDEEVMTDDTNTKESRALSPQITPGLLRQFALIYDNQIKLHDYLAGHSNANVGIDGESVANVVTSVLTPHTDVLRHSVAEISGVSRDIAVTRNLHTDRLDEINSKVSQLLCKDSFIYDNASQLEAKQGAESPSRSIEIIPELVMELRKSRQSLDSLANKIETTLSRIAEITSNPSSSSYRDTSHILDTISELRKFSQEMPKLLSIEDRITNTCDQVIKNVETAISEVIKTLEKKGANEMRAIEATNNRIESLIEKVEVSRIGSSDKYTKISDHDSQIAHTGDKHEVSDHDTEGLGMVYTSFVFLSTIIMLLSVK